MLRYQAPTREQRFVLHEVLKLGELLPTLAGHDHVDSATVDAMLEAGAKLVIEQLLPLRESADREGCRLVDGQVRAPAGFADAYRLFQAGGWPALTVPLTSGGQGFPAAAGALFQEMMTAGNLAFDIFAHVREGVLDCIAADADESVQALFVPPLASGEWLGTMCLSEPQSGTDLGLVRTLATPLADGRWSLRGTKIFISNGDHDLTPNIVHMVLARTPDAPAGTAGLSLFAVPKRHIGEHGALGERNGVSVVGVEHKHGIRGNATCVLSFEDAQGWLVGKAHRGLAGMFRLMNSARLAVGVQAVGLSEIAYQNALAYAHERLQGRALPGPARPDLPADPLIAHVGVRAKLTEMRLFIEPARLLIAWVGLLIDTARSHADPARRKRSLQLAELMTPVVKAWLTEQANHHIGVAMRLFGGAGYLAETGMEQLLRDAAIGPIYEGTNDIQALDLLGRKTLADQGERLRVFGGEIEHLAGRMVARPRLRPLAAMLGTQAKQLGELALEIMVDSVFYRDVVGLCAPDFLDLTSSVTFSYLWCWMALAADEAAPSGAPERYYADKLALARMQLEQAQARLAVLGPRIKANRRRLEQLAQFDWKAGAPA